MRKLLFWLSLMCSVAMAVSTVSFYAVQPGVSLAGTPDPANGDIDGDSSGYTGDDTVALWQTIFDSPRPSFPPLCGDVDGDSDEDYYDLLIYIQNGGAWRPFGALDSPPWYPTPYTVSQFWTVPAWDISTPPMIQGYPVWFEFNGTPGRTFPDLVGGFWLDFQDAKPVATDSNNDNQEALDFTEDPNDIDVIPPIDPNLDFYPYAPPGEGNLRVNTYYRSNSGGWAWWDDDNDGTPNCVDPDYPKDGGIMIQEDAYIDTWDADGDGVNDFWDIQAEDPVDQAIQDYIQEHGLPAPYGGQLAKYPVTQYLPTASTGRLSGSNGTDFDLDGTCTVLDLIILLESVYDTGSGDCDFDKDYDAADWVVIMAAGKYEDSVTANGWRTEGDFNLDHEVSAADFVQAGNYGLPYEN